MKIDDKIRDEKLQYEINREEAKIPQLSSSKIDNRRRNITSWSKRVIKQAKSAYSPLAKAFEEQTKKTQKIKKIKGEKALEALEDYGKKLVKSSGEIVFNTLTLISVVGVIPLPPFPSCWFSFNNSEKIKSVTWHFATFSNHFNSCQIWYLQLTPVFRYCTKLRRRYFQLLDLWSIPYKRKLS